MKIKIIGEHTSITYKLSISRILGRLLFSIFLFTILMLLFFRGMEESQIISFVFAEIIGAFLYIPNFILFFNYIIRCKVTKLRITNDEILFHFHNGYKVVRLEEVQNIKIIEQGNNDNVYRRPSPWFNFEHFIFHLAGGDEILVTCFLINKHELLESLPNLKYVFIKKFYPII